LSVPSFVEVCFSIMPSGSRTQPLPGLVLRAGIRAMVSLTYWRCEY
jgi:hypothetical protein